MTTGKNYIYMCGSEWHYHLPPPFFMDPFMTHFREICICIFNTSKRSHPCLDLSEC
jgi:hypothetical protein